MIQEIIEQSREDGERPNACYLDSGKSCKLLAAKTHGFAGDIPEGERNHRPSKETCMVARGRGMCV